MSWAQARGDQPGGELKAGLDTDFHGEIVSVLELVVTDDWHEGAEHLEGAVEIHPRFDGIGQSHLGIPTKLEGAAAVVALNIFIDEIVIIYIQLLPDRTDSASDEWAKLHFSRPSKDAVDLNRNLN